MKAIRLGLGALAFALLALFVTRRLRVTNDIAHFLPAADDPTLGELSRAMAGSELAGTVILNVVGDDRARAADGARRLAAALERDPDVAWVRHGVDERTERAFYDLYFAHRLGFASDDPRPLDDAALRAAAGRLKDQLIGPAGPLVRRLAPDDPLLAFGAAIDRFRALEDRSLVVEDGQLVTRDGNVGVVFLGAAPSPLDAAGQARLFATIDRRFEAIGGSDLRLETSGVGRYTVAISRSIASDITRISTVSTVGVLALFFVAFRSLRYVALGVVPLAFGTVCAMAVGIVCFGEIHGLTLAFGSSLIGTGMDYAEHFFTHHVLAPDPGGPEAGFRKLFPGLFLGALTTVAGLVGLAATSFPGLREIAIFSSVGVAAALFATWCFVPPLTPESPGPAGWQRRATRALTRSLDVLGRGRKYVWLLPLAAIVVSIVGSARARWIDDVSTLSSAPAALIAEDERVRARVSDADAGRFVVVVGANEEDALAKNDALAVELEAARRDGLMTGFRSLHALLWSRALQARSAAVFRGIGDRLVAAFEAEGFTRDAFRPFVASLGKDQPPLTFADLAESPLADLARPFRVDLADGRVAILTRTVGLRDPSALAARLGDRGRVFDQQAFLESAYGRFRVRTLEMVGVGLGFVFLVTFARYRDARHALAAFVPAVLAGTTTLALLVLAGQTLNLMHLVGTLLVLSSGADYGIFVVESRDHEDDLGATLLSLVVAMSTTVLSFGLLAMSANAALRALGLTAGIGVVASVILAPTALVLLGRRQPK